MTWRCCPVHVVDQDPTALQETVHILRSRDFAVTPHAAPIDFLDGIDALPHGCVVIDLLSPALSMEAAARRLNRMAAPNPFVTLTDSQSQDAAIAAMRAGAIDVLRKPADPDRLASAILSGCTRLLEWKREAAGRLHLAERLDCLSAREQEVLAGLARGGSNKGIARDLGISDRTVEVHRASMMQKLDVPSLADALRLAFEVERQLPGTLPTPAIRDWREPPVHAKMAKTEEDRPWLPPSHSARR